MKPRVTAAALAGACVLLATTLAVAPGSQRRGPAAPCSGSWTSPLELRTREGSWIYTGAPEIVRSRQGLVLLWGRSWVTRREGDSSLIIDRTPIGALLLDDRSAELIRSPAPDRRILWPRAVADDSGIVHMVWGEAQDSTPVVPHHVERLRYARFDGSDWSPPETIVESAALDWEPSIHSSLVRHADELFVAVPESKPLRDTHILVLRRVGTRWLVSRGGVPVSAAYADLAVLSDGRLVLAYVAAALGVGRDRNSLFVTVSRDTGRTWSTPTWLHRGGRTGAADPRLAVGGGSDVRLLWVQDDEDDPTTDSLVMAVSSDGGTTWGPLSAIAIAGGVQGNLAVARGPDPDVVFPGADSLALRHLEWRRGRWSECPLPRRPAAFGYAFATVGGERLMVWTPGPRSGVQGGAYVTILSWLR